MASMHACTVAKLVKVHFVVQWADVQGEMLQVHWLLSLTKKFKGSSVPILPFTQAYSTLVPPIATVSSAVKLFPVQTQS